MRRGLLLFITILLLVHMADANPGPGEGLFDPVYSFPGETFSDGSYYPDPDNLLAPDELLDPGDLDSGELLDDENFACSLCHLVKCNCIEGRPSFLPSTPFPESNSLPLPERNPNTYAHSAPPAPQQSWRPFPHIVLPPALDTQSNVSWQFSQENSGIPEFGMSPNVRLAVDSHSPGRPSSTPSERSQSSRLRKQPKKDGFPCSNCRRSFNRQSDLNRHSKTHLPKDGRPHLCPFCEEGFLYPKDLRRHYRTHNSNMNKYTCSDESCEATFTRKDNLNRHIRQSHSTSTLNTMTSFPASSMS